MPVETQQAVDLALTQYVDYGFGIIIRISKDTPTELVDKVREYFNTNNIEYTTFSYDDLELYLV